MKDAVMRLPVSSASLTPSAAAEEEDMSRRVELALLRLALGYEYTDERGRLHVVPPDPRSAIYWLENRSPVKWGKNRNSAASGEKFQPQLFIFDEEKDV